MLLLPLLFGYAPKAVQSASLWQPLAQGIEYREFFLPTPNHFYVARMQRDDPQATLESSIAQGRLSGGLETVRQMAARYDQAIGYWGEEWGAREQVVVAINGFFYDPETGIPRSGQVQSGWYAKRFDERQNGSGFAWTLQREAFVGGCVAHRRNKQVLTFLKTGETLPFDDINAPRGEDALVIYTPHYDATTLSDEKGVEALVALSRPMMILPLPAMITGTVQTVRAGEGNMQIPFDGVVLSASGTAAIKLQELAQVGEVVGISQEIRHFAPDCNTPDPTEWTKTYASVGASFVFLKDGAIQKLGELGAVLRSPRTAIAFNEQYLYFIVVDGRIPYESLGTSMVELAIFARNYLEAQWGAALDGGGSTTMVVNGKLMNRPNTEVEDPNFQAGEIERAVANGMMMVVVQPRERSSKFRAGEQVQAAGGAEMQVRLGPGSNYAVVGTTPPGSQGVVIEHRLNGVLAKGAHWWKVAFGELAGWVSEDALLEL